MHGGLKIYRGNPAAARAYVEADRARVDDYYLAEGTGLAARLVVTPDGIVEMPAMDGPTYERWVAGHIVDPDREARGHAGRSKGRLRSDDQAVRFVEVTVNGPKTWSLAAAVDPEIGTAYDAAQDRAAHQIIGWLAEHATTRVGPRGRQVQVPLEELEAAVVRHYTSRAGDPHRHLHLQVNARVWAQGRWRGLHTVGVRDSLEAINGIGHAAVMCDPGFRTVLAAHGYTLDPETGEITQLAGLVGAFSARAKQIETHIDSYEAAWRAGHHGQEPGSTLRRAWDRRAWATARPDKVLPTDGAELTARWVEELSELGFQQPDRPESAARVVGMRPGSVDRDSMVETALTRLGARRSAWNPADARGEVEKLIAAAGVVTDSGVRGELAEDLTARVVAASRPLLARGDVPEHVRALTSTRVLAVEHELIAQITARAEGEAFPAYLRELRGRVDGLDADQRAAVAHLTGTGRIIVVEGAAGAGKTAMLAAARTVSLDQGHRMVVVTPTRRAAMVAEGQIGAASYPVAWLLYQHGFRWDDDGHWARVPSRPDVAARLRAGDLVVVDEAGMLDQDTARALLIFAAEAGVRVGLVGDRHQLPAVGRGGVLDLAVRYASDRTLTLEGVRRFADPAYADLSARMRHATQPGEVFDELLRRGQIVVHASEVERQQALAVRASRGELVVADNREQVSRINGLAHQVRVLTGEVNPRGARDAGDGVVTSAGERIGVGDRVATRRNDPEVDVANRETWTVADTDRGCLTVVGEAGRRTLPAAYVREHVELAYATTAYGAQGQTVPSAHVSVGDHTGASSAYVGMTRGHHRNTAHLVAPTLEDARRQWVEVFGRDRADLGPAHAARLAAEAVERYGPAAPGARPASPARPARPAPYVPARRGRPVSPAELESRDQARRRRNQQQLTPAPPSPSLPSSRSPAGGRGIGF
ncbi:MAG TPA: MobF family relaxase [Nocardioides sp.]|uniref:MobF family relaxase n=1 Tax=Nocardioides sp. TaxID=35761 RepID=UPI002F3EC128